MRLTFYHSTDNSSITSEPVCAVLCPPFPLPRSLPSSSPSPCYRIESRRKRHCFVCPRHVSRSGLFVCWDGSDRLARTRSAGWGDLLSPKISTCSAPNGMLFLTDGCESACCSERLAFSLNKFYFSSSKETWLLELRRRFKRPAPPLNFSISIRLRWLANINASHNANRSIFPVFWNLWIVIWITWNTLIK